MSTLDRLIRPRSVAVIGASADASKMTARPVGYLLKHGFAGQIYPVNPRAREIAGLRCYPDIGALPATPDVGLVLLGPDRAEQVVRDLAGRGAAAAIVIASGYAETGDVGAARQRELTAAAGEMHLLGPNTIGLVNLTDGVMLSVSAALEIGDLPVGRISLVSQSGGILGSLLSRAADRGIGFAKLVATGNEADLDCTDFIGHFVDDEASSVIAVYLEGLRRPDRFREAVQRASALGKAVVVYKVGRSESGARAATSHTGALAGADRVYDALFRQCGAIRAQTFADLLDIPAALVSGRRARGRRVAILTSTGGVATLVADSCGVAGFALPRPDAATAARLGGLRDGSPATASANPVDVTLAGLEPDLFRSAIAALLKSATYDAVIVIVGSSALAEPHIVADAALECQGRSDKPLLAYVSPHAPHIVRLLNERGIPTFAAPETCASALEALQAYPGELRRTALRPTVTPGEAAGNVGVPFGSLNEAESKALFARFGIAAVREEAVSTAAAAEAAARRLGPRVAVKILSRQIAHKSDLGGVRVGVLPEEVRHACETMLDGVRRAGAPEPEGFLVQELVATGVEMMLGIHRDPQLGLVVVLGMGGVAAELLDDTAIRLLPIVHDDAAAMIAELKTGKLLAGYRGAVPSDVGALVDAVLAFAAMGETLGDRLIEAEINPLMVLPAGQGVRAVDGMAVLWEPSISG